MGADLSTRTGAEEFITRFLADTHTVFKRNGEVRPMGLILATKNPRSGERMSAPVPAVIVPESFENVDDKEGFSTGLRELAMLMDAVGLVFVSECWTLDTDAASEVSQWVGRISEHPRRQEVVAVMFEHRTIPGGRMYRAEIARAGDVAILGDFVALPDPQGSRAEGRFVGLLPPDGPTA